MPRAAAAATYYAAREVSRRVLAPLAPPPLALALLSASAASAAALVVRAPADVLATRAQVRRRGEEVATTTAEAAAVGFRRWPTLFAAELPYSLLRILGLAALDAAAPAGGGGVLDATERTVAVAVVAALLTTPLDVARTRVLLRTAPGAADAGPPALAATLAEVAAEGSLFSGAALRVAYTGRRRGVHPAPDALLRRAPGLDHPRRCVPVRRDHVEIPSGASVILEIPAVLALPYGCGSGGASRARRAARARLVRLKSRRRRAAAAAFRRGSLDRFAGTEQVKPPPRSAPSHVPPPCLRWSFAPKAGALRHEDRRASEGKAFRHTSQAQWRFQHSPGGSNPTKPGSPQTHFVGAS